MHRIPCEMLTVFSKNITVKVATWQDGAVQFSDKIQDFPTDLKQTQSSKIMCYLLPVMYGVFDNSGNHSLNGQQFKTHQIDTITTPPKFGPKQLYILPKFCHFLFHFLRIETFDLTATKYLCVSVRNKFSFINVIVQLLYSIRQGFLIFFCAMDPFEMLVKPTDPFS